MKTFCTIMFWFAIVLAIASFGFSIYCFSQHEPTSGLLAAFCAGMNIVNTGLFYMGKEL